MQALRSSASSALRQAQRRNYSAASSPYAQTAKNLMIVSPSAVEARCSAPTGLHGHGTHRRLRPAHTDPLRQVSDSEQRLTQATGCRHQAPRPRLHRKARFLPRPRCDRLWHQCRWWHESQESWHNSSRSTGVCDRGRRHERDWRQRICYLRSSTASCQIDRRGCRG